MAFTFFPPPSNISVLMGTWWCHLFGQNVSIAQEESYHGDKWTLTWSKTFGVPGSAFNHVMSWSQFSPHHYNPPLLCILMFTPSVSWWCKTRREEENIALIRGIGLPPRHWEMPCKHLNRRYSERVNVASRQTTCRMDKEESKVEWENMMNVFFSLDFPIVNECFSGFPHPSRLMHDLANPEREEAFRKLTAELC